jgi:lipopolysaccharide export system protein LptC
MSIGMDARVFGGVVGEARRAGAFAAARRHSLLVRALRVALIVGAVGIVVALTALGLLRTFRSSIGRISIGAAAIDGRKITMDKPRLTGARRDGEGYVINAAKAIQDITRPTEVELVAIDGDIGAADHDTLHMAASTGHYDTLAEKLDLSGVVRLWNSRYSVDLSEATIDFKIGVYVSSRPVAVTFGEGNSIVADSAVVRDNAREITFEGHVRSIFRASDGEADAAKSIKGTDP